MKRGVAIAAIGLVLLGALAAAFYGFRRIGWPQGLPTQDQELQHYLTYLAGATAVAGLTASLLKWNPWAALLACVAALAVFSGNGQALVAALLVLLASLVVGRAVLRLFRVREEAAGLTASLLVGAGMYGTLIGLAAPYPVHYAWTYGPALLLPILLGRRWIAAEGGAWLRRRHQPQLPHWGAAAVDGLIGGIALVHVGIALLPEMGQDALAVHLYVGNQLATRHAWSFDTVKYVWAVMPMLADWIFAAGIMLGGETAARLLNVGFIGLVAVLVRELVRWCGGNSAAQRWALLVFLSMPLTFSLAVSLFIESIWTSFVLAGVLALLRVVGDDGKPREAVPAGVFIGFALAAKAVTLTLMPILLAVLLARPRKWLTPGGIASVVGATVLGILLGGFPYVNAWLRTGNPVFPFFNALFRSPLYPIENFESASMFSRWLRWDFPYQSAFNSIQFIEGQPGSGGFQWLLVVVPAAVLLVLAWRRRALALLLIALGSIVIAFASVAYLRYVFPAFALACAAAGVALADDRFGRAPRVMLGVVAAGAVAMNLLFLGAGSPYRDFAFHALRDKATREAWLELRLPLRRAVSLVNELNTGGAPVAVLGSPVLGHLAADALIPSWYNYRFYHLMGVPRTGPDMVKTLQDEGVEYILYDPTWPQPPRPKAIVETVTEPVASYGVASLRRFKDEFRFRQELLANPRFQDATGWHFGGPPPRPGGGLVVAGADAASQVVPVQPLRRYVNEITVRCDPPSGARAQVNWLSAEGLFLKTDIQVYECGKELSTFRMEAVAPPGAANAAVYAVGHAGGRVEFQQNSLRR